MGFSSVAQSGLTLCNRMNGSTPGLPVHHQLPEPTQTHVYCVGDVIQPSHPLSPPSPPAPNPSQHQGNESALCIRWPKYWSFSFNIQKTKIMASSPITLWQIVGKTVETVADFILRVSKSLQMVTAAMKLKDTCSLEGKL